jgi:hypothetical protein
VTETGLPFDSEDTDMSTDDLADVGPADKVVRPRLIGFRVIAYAIAWGLCLGLFPHS